MLLLPSSISAHETLVDGDGDSGGSSGHIGYRMVEDLWVEMNAGKCFLHDHRTELHGTPISHRVPCFEFAISKIENGISAPERTEFGMGQRKSGHLFEVNYYNIPTFDQQ